MLPIPVLDDELFSEIVKNARNMIPRLNPNWTDYNSHDPGITFLELFAFLKENQQYHLDQIGPKNRKKYLKLLGMEQQQRAAARTTAVVSGRVPGDRLPRGTRLIAGDVTFETDCDLGLSGSRLKGGFIWDGEKSADFAAGVHAAAGKLRLEMFGREAKAGSMCYLCFDQPWVPEQPIRLQLWLCEEGPIRRNSVAGEMFVPLVQLTWEYLAHDGWKSVTVAEDETHGLLFSGRLTLKTDEQPCPAVRGDGGELCPGSGGAYWIRGRLVQGGYDVPPVLAGVSDGVAPVVQRETDALCRQMTAENGAVREESLLAAAGEYQVYLADEEGLWHPVDAEREYDNGAALFRLPEDTEGEILLLAWRPEFSVKRQLARGDGFPCQSYSLPKKGQLPGDFVLLVEETDRPDVWSVWTRVEDLDTSGAEDRHYILDEEEGVVSFGDCIYGMAPEGRILIAGHAVTRGTGGNIKAGTLTNIRAEDLRILGGEEGEIRVHNPDDAFGGRDREQEEACFRRFRRQLRRSDRAVTDEDYERLVRQTPGLMIANCKAIPVDRIPRRDGSLDENCVTIVVEPYSPAAERVLTSAYRENILGYLEDKRMLGTKVSLLSPEYIRITIYAEILSQPQYLDAGERIRAAVEAYFQKGWEFGEPVRYSELYGILDAMDCVQRVESLTIDAQGRGISRGINGDVILPHNGLAVLHSGSYQVRPGK